MATKTHHGEARRGHPRSRDAVGALAIALTLVVAPLTVGTTLSTWSSVAAVGDVVATPDTTPADDTDEPEDTTPADGTGDPDAGTTPSTEPPASTPSDEAATGSAASDDSSTTVTLIAVVATGILLLVAVWWMLRRSDGDRPPTDPEWPDSSEVI